MIGSIYRLLMQRLVSMDSEAVSLIQGALLGGATHGIEGTASAAVREAYTHLRGMIADRFKSHPKAMAALEQHDNQPETMTEPLKQPLLETGTVTDPAILEAARMLVSLLNAMDGEHVDRATTVHGSTGVQINDGGRNVQINRFSDH